MMQVESSLNLGLDLNLSPAALMDGLFDHPVRYASVVPDVRTSETPAYQNSFSHPARA